MPHRRIAVRSILVSQLLAATCVVALTGCGSTRDAAHASLTRAVTGRTIISRRAHLPLSAEFDAPGGDCTLHIASTAFSEEGNVFLDVAVLLDGEVISNQTMFSNHPQVHRALVGPVIPLYLARGRYTIELKTGNTTTFTDDNDRFEVVLIQR